MPINLIAIDRFITDGIIGFFDDDYAHNELQLSAIQRRQVPKGNRENYSEPPIAYKNWKTAMAWSVIKHWQDKPFVMIVGFFGLAFFVGQILSWTVKYGFSLFL